jgi:DnaJ domain
MENRRNFYRILQVQPDAPVEIIKASYRTLMQRLRMHPDLGGDHGNAALINEAFAVLTNPAKRAEYDRELGRRLRTTGQGQKRAAEATPEPQHNGTGGLIDCLFCRTVNRASANQLATARCTSCGSPLVRTERVLLGTDGKRVITRLPRNHPLTLYSSWPTARPLRGESRDVSLNGISFVTPEMFRPDSIVKVDSALCLAVVRVLNVRVENDGADGQWLVGGSFLSVIFPQSRGGFLSADA